MIFKPFTLYSKTTNMTRLIFLNFILIFSLSNTSFAQDEFSELSSKKRISIAEKEEKEAVKDQEFQTLMQTGHEYFKGKHYLKAIHSYEAAQGKRPYNVYPKVIISDIELSMKDTLATLRAAEKAEEQSRKLKKAEKPEKIDEPKEEKPDTQVESEKDRMKKQQEWEKKQRERLEREREQKKEEEKAKPAEVKMAGDVAVLSTEDFQKELGEQFPNGTTEEMYTEGNKTITKRIVVTNNLGNEYKKVVHNWGGVFYFKNGDAVTERVWIQETEK